MRSPLSPSCSSSSSSSYSLAATSLNSRLLTIFKKAHELTTLCDIDACVIHYGPDGELKTWPENRDKVRDLALRYIQLDKAKRLKKSVNLYEFLNKVKDKKKTMKMTNTLQKKAKMNVEESKCPVSGHYSVDQINQLIHSLELSYSTLQERRRFLEAKKQKESLNPSQFTPLPQESCVYDQNISFQHLCASDYSAVQESSLRYHQLMPYGGYDQNMCMANINNIQHPCDSNSPDYLVLPPVLQDSVSNYELDQMMQHEPSGFDQNMCMGDTTNNNVLDDFCFDFRDPYGGNRSFSQDFPDMSSSYVDEKGLLQASSLPYL